MAGRFFVPPATSGTWIVLGPNKTIGATVLAPASRGATVWMPELVGEIERRLLVNYRVDPEVLTRLLPAPFRPQVVNGVGVAGICLIRLGGMRPSGVPGWAGRGSENAAHRIAVEWDDADGTRTGVYIPRRDSDSMINVLVGGRLYPGEHHRARFDVHESDTEVHVSYTAQDGSAHVDVRASVVADLLGSVLFPYLEDASRFFEQGSVGLSATRCPGRFDGLELRTNAWRVEPAVVHNVQSSFFEDQSHFPNGAIDFDSALIMRSVPVEWRALSPLHAAAPMPTAATRPTSGA